MYHHDGEQLGFYWKRTYQNTRLSKKEDILVVFVFQETKNLFDKNRIQNKIKCHI